MRSTKIKNKKTIFFLVYLRSPL